MPRRLPKKAPEKRLAYEKAIAEERGISGPEGILPGQSPDTFSDGLVRNLFAPQHVDGRHFIWCSFSINWP